jgi:hypothetical protein
MNKLERAGRAAVCCMLAASVGACATVTRGSNQAWTVTSTPPGATVRTTVGFACEATPCTFKMPRKSAFEVTIAKPGYKTYKGKVVHVISAGGGAGFVGNALIGGVIGAGVDVATGATLDLKPNPMAVTLEAEIVAATPTPAAQATPTATPTAQASMAANPPPAAKMASPAPTSAPAPAKAVTSATPAA